MRTPINASYRNPQFQAHCQKNWASLPCIQHTKVPHHLLDNLFYLFGTWEDLATQLDILVDPSATQFHLLLHMPYTI